MTNPSIHLANAEASCSLRTIRTLARQQGIKHPIEMRAAAYNGYSAQHAQSPWVTNGHRLSRYIKRARWLAQSTTGGILSIEARPLGGWGEEEELIQIRFN